MNNKPSIFKGGYDPDGAQRWIEGIERIFGAMSDTYQLYPGVNLQ
ncbi:hypothetical protein A2U01_0114225, partial [Trifolium medium]|nr:hypothetical protein [Trifolium medium]